MPAPAVSTRLLYDDSPLIVLPQLAALIGTDEALMLQQIHYWLKVAGKERDGRLWIYNSQTSWAQQLPMWKKAKVGRVLAALRARGLVRVANYNRLALDRTFWYSIDYEALAALLPDATLHLPPGSSGPAAAGPPPEPARLANDPPRIETDPPRIKTDPPRIKTDPPRIKTDPAWIASDPTIPETTSETTSETCTETNAEREGGAPAPVPAPPPPTVETLTIDDGLTAWLAAECAHVGVPGRAIDVARETAIWRDHHRRKGSAPADAAADWRIWMHRAIAYARRHPDPLEVLHGQGTGAALHAAEPTVERPPASAPAERRAVAAQLRATLRAAAGIGDVPG